jgi:hypothetical protein
LLINIRVGKDVYVLVLRLYQVRIITVFTVFGCWLILSVYIIMSFDFPFVRRFNLTLFLSIDAMIDQTQKLYWLQSNLPNVTFQGNSEISPRPTEHSGWLLHVKRGVSVKPTPYISTFNHSFINHDNVFIPCTNNFDQTRSLYYYKCKWTYHVRKSTASKRTPHASHIAITPNAPLDAVIFHCSLGRSH